MNLGDVRYGTVVGSTFEGADQEITLMIVAVPAASDAMFAAVLKIDTATRFWREGCVVDLPATDFWRFEVVE
jgi:hypothetical protein